MKIFRGLDEARGIFGPCALTIGNFDGVHAGHRALLQSTVERAAALEVRPAALTFHPHPATIVAPQRAPRLLTSIEERCALLGAGGLTQALVLPFTPAVAALTPEAFARDVLAAALEVRAVVVGANFHFGAGQAGDPAVLAALGERYGFSVAIVPPVTRRGFTVSSSRIRALLAAGRTAAANRLLERPFALAGPVVHGAGRGRRETVPTLNLAPGAGQLPANGVYVTRTHDAATGQAWRSVTNVGIRPTFDSGAVSVETHLLDALVGPAPQSIRVEFLWRLREERAFPAPAALLAQIRLDVARAEAYFRRCARWTARSAQVIEE